MYRMRVRVRVRVPPKTFALCFALLLPNLEAKQHGRAVAVPQAAAACQIQDSRETAPLLAHDD